MRPSESRAWEELWNWRFVDVTTGCRAKPRPLTNPGLFRKTDYLADQSTKTARELFNWSTHALSIRDAEWAHTRELMRLIFKHYSDFEPLLSFLASLLLIRFGNCSINFS